MIIFNKAKWEEEKSLEKKFKQKLINNKNIFIFLTNWKKYIKNIKVDKLWEKEEERNFEKKRKKGFDNSDNGCHLMTYTISILSNNIKWCLSVIWYFYISLTEVACLGITLDRIKLKWICKIIFKVMLNSI